MVTISYHVSHEQFAPSELLDLVRHAERSGFDAAFSSDHFQPWVPAQGHSGYLWAWLGAAMQATTRLEFAAITVPGGWRHHPAVVAQAIATMGEMYPDRLSWIALGSGEALNECVAGKGWPDKEERNARLRESVGIIRRLLRGEVVTSHGAVPIERARVWSRPARSMPLVGAALSESTAASVAQWADGLLTRAGNVAELSKIVGAFRRSAPTKPMHAKVDLSWAPTEEEALRQAQDQWAFASLPREVLADLRTPEEFERAARHVAPDQVRASVCVSSNAQRHIDWLQQHLALGFQTLDLHNVGRNQREFIDFFGERVLPALRTRNDRPGTY